MPSGASDDQKLQRYFNGIRVRGFILNGAPLRHTKLGTPKPADFAPDAATSVRRSTLFDPMMRSFFWSTTIEYIRQKSLKMLRLQQTLLDALGRIGRPNSVRSSSRPIPAAPILRKQPCQIRGRHGAESAARPMA
jgi:hypothetical protein